jgi:hypothetical protein
MATKFARKSFTADPMNARSGMYHLIYSPFPIASSPTLPATERFGCPQESPAMKPTAITPIIPLES